MLRNLVYGGIGLVGGAIAGIAIADSTATRSPQRSMPAMVGSTSAAQPEITLASATSRTSANPEDCSPWEVSDIAMEAMLKEMIRRGWRPPSQAEALASFDAPYGSLAQPVDPGAYVPLRGYSSYAESAESSADDEANASTAEDGLSPPPGAPASSESIAAAPAPGPALVNEAVLPPLGPPPGQ